MKGILKYKSIFCILNFYCKYSLPKQLYLLTSIKNWKSPWNDNVKQWLWYNNNYARNYKKKHVGWSSSCFWVKPWQKVKVLLFWMGISNESEMPGMLNLYWNHFSNKYFRFMDSLYPFWRHQDASEYCRERYTRPSQPSNIQVINDFYLMKSRKIIPL